MLSVGDKAPSFTLPAVDGGEEVTDPWTEGPTVLAFFKTSCPVCKMVAPMLTKLSEGGARVVAVGEDPPGAITQYNESQGQRVQTTLTQSAPYDVSAAYGLEAVPERFRVWYSALNPLAPVIDGYRRTVLFGKAPQWHLLAPGALTATVVLVGGYLLFKRLEGGIADVA